MASTYTLEELDYQFFMDNTIRVIMALIDSKGKKIGTISFILKHTKAYLENNTKIKLESTNIKNFLDVWGCENYEF